MHACIEHAPKQRKLINYAGKVTVCTFLMVPQVLFAHAFTASISPTCACSDWCTAGKKAVLIATETSTVPISEMPLPRPYKASTLERIVTLTKKLKKEQDEVRHCKFNVPTATLSTIMKNKEKIWDGFVQSLILRQEGESSELQISRRGSSTSEVASKCNSAILMNRVGAFALQAGYKDFSCTNSWFNCFETQNNEASKAIYGKIGWVETAVENWRSHWPAGGGLWQTTFSTWMKQHFFCCPFKHLCRREMRAHEPNRKRNELRFCLEQMLLVKKKLLVNCHRKVVEYPMLPKCSSAQRHTL